MWGHVGSSGRPHIPRLGRIFRPVKLLATPWPLNLRICLRTMRPHAMFQQLITQNSPQDGLLALVTAIAFMGFLIGLRQFVLMRLTRVAGTTKTLIDDFLVEVLLATRFLLAAASGLYVATHFLTLPASLSVWTDRIFVALLILQVGFWANRGLEFWLKNRFSGGDEMDQGARAMTSSMLSFLGRITLWAVVVLLSLDNMGLNVTALVASLGIGGIAVALAAQNILGDLFASLSISIDKPFVIGDFIMVDDLLGSVEHVGLKTTRIRSLGGEQIIFSNNDLLKSRIRNYKRMQERRAVFAIGVTYDTPADQLAQIPQLIRQAIESQDKVRFDRAHFKSFGAFSLDFEVVYYVLEPDFNLYMDVQHAVNLRLVSVFADHSIAFAFPTQTLHVAGRVQLGEPAPRRSGPAVSATTPATSTE